VVLVFVPVPIVGERGLYGVAVEVVGFHNRKGNVGFTKERRCLSSALG
jgi:hypothetical protein